jgi:hypothetical protein
MATARNLHTDAQWPINILTDGTVPLANQFMQIAPLDTMAFQNGAPFPVKIVFTSVFTTINPLQPRGNSGPLGGSAPLNTTINFTIYNANTGLKTGGPYAIQFGIGPLSITITAESTNPDPIAIPKGGQIQFNCTDVSYPILWQFANGQTANVWSPQPNPLVQGLNSPQRALAGATSQQLSYTLNPTKETHGGGTVNVGS